MAMTNVSTSTATAAPPSTGTSYGPALAVLTTLFFIWGSLTSLNDVIIPFAQNTFKVNIAESMLIQTAFFLAYFIFSIPSAKIIDWIGYKWAIIVGLGTMIAACLLFYPAARIPSSWLPGLPCCRWRQIPTLRCLDGRKQPPAV